MKKHGMLIVLWAALIILIMAGFHLGYSAPVQAGADEIIVAIHLNLKEDIGLLLMDCDIGEKHETGGVSNADHSMLKRGDTLYWHIDKQHAETDSATVDLTMQFTAVTEYYPPNFDNLYPQESMLQMDGVSFAANFGQKYTVTITGGKEEGYTAVYEGTSAGCSVSGMDIKAAAMPFWHLICSP